MAIQPEKTKDGIKLRDTKTGNLAGSVPTKGKKEPQASPTNVVAPILVEEEPKPIISPSVVEAIARAKAEQEHPMVALIPGSNQQIVLSEGFDEAPLMALQSLDELVLKLSRENEWLIEAYKGSGYNAYWTVDGILEKLTYWTENYEPKPVVEKPLPVEGEEEEYDDEDEEDEMLDKVSSPDPAFRFEDNPLFAKEGISREAIARLGYETYLSQPYPCFVYGTLRPGDYNFERVLRSGGINSIKSSTMPGLSIYQSQGASFPFSAEDETEGAIVAGDLIDIRQDSYGYRLRKRLDGLESFYIDYPLHSMYNRVAKKVVYTEDGVEKETLAWVYVASNRSKAEVNPKDRIASGDWFSDLKGKHIDLAKREIDLLPTSWGNKD